MPDQFDRLSPRDVVITIRSLGRRFDEVSGAARSDSAVFDRLDAAGPGGSSLPELVVSAARELTFLANEVDRALNSADPVVPRAVIDPDERTFDDPDGGRTTMTDGAAAIGDESARLGERLDKLEAAAWGRAAAVAGGGQVTVLDLAREVARTGIGHLRAAEAQLQWLRETA